MAVSAQNDGQAGGFAVAGPAAYPQTPSTVQKNRSESQVLQAVRAQDSAAWKHTHHHPKSAAGTLQTNSCLRNSRFSCPSTSKFGTLP